MPDLVVLNELAPSEWTLPLLKELGQRMHRGLHLVVIGPPALPPANDERAGELRKLLPAWSVPVPASDNSTPLPQTVDRLPMLCFAFDYNALWSSVNSVQPEGLLVQAALANAVLKPYREAGLVAGDFQVRTDANDPATRVIHYERPANQSDRLQIVVAPKVSAAVKDAPCDPALANFILPGLVDLGWRRASRSQAAPCGPCQRGAAPERRAPWPAISAGD